MVSEPTRVSTILSFQGGATGRAVVGSSELNFRMQSSVGRHIAFVVNVMIWLMATSRTADAYIGPGAGISAIGTVIALPGAVVLAIVGFIWYPARRLLAMVRRRRGQAVDRTIAQS
jgi:hypothetical protein